MIKTTVIDGHGTDNSLRINGEGELSVVVHPHPPHDEGVNSFLFRQYFKNLSNNSFDMRVNGATTNQIFTIKASNDVDIYIKSCSFVIADAGAVLNKFGNIDPLTNGIEFNFFSTETGTLQIHEALKTNGDFCRLSGGNPTVGSGVDLWKATNFIGASEAYIPFMDLASVFGLPWGIRLRKKSLDSINLVIKDNLTAIDQFDVIAYGTQFY